MKELIDKLSSYNLFNYLLPGVVYISLLQRITGYDLMPERIFEGFFLYYFTGLIISRVGSIIIEPLLLKFGVISRRPYDEFVKASLKDKKLDVLSESNNLYRTICSMLLFLLIFLLFDIFEFNWIIKIKTLLILIIPVLIILFIFSYRKQTKYINSRISSLINNDK